MSVSCVISLRGLAITRDRKRKVAGGALFPKCLGQPINCFFPEFGKSGVESFAEMPGEFSGIVPLDGLCGFQGSPIPGRPNEKYEFGLMNSGYSSGI